MRVCVCVCVGVGVCVCVDVGVGVDVGACVCVQSTTLYLCLVNHSVQHYHDILLCLLSPQGLLPLVMTFTLPLSGYLDTNSPDIQQMMLAYSVNIHIKPVSHLRDFSLCPHTYTSLASD